MVKRCVGTTQGQKRKRIVFAVDLLENKDMMWRQGLMALGGFMALFFVVLAPSVLAAESSSSNYSVDRVFFGAGGELEACSDNYCSKQTAGEVAAGHTAGSAFRAQAGFNVEREPYIAFSVAGNTTDLGYLSKTSATYTEATFAVKTYLSSGYVVQLASNPPTNTSPGGYMLNALSTPTASTPGTEQFGVNLVENTTSCGAPGDFGAGPVQVPDNTFSFGEVASGYDTCGLFKYVKEDVVASSDRSTGETDFTISFIYNVEDLTPSGEYVFNGALVATATF